MGILVIWAESVNRASGGSIHFWGLMHGLKSIHWQAKAIVPLYWPGEAAGADNVYFIRVGPRSFISFSFLQLLTVFCLPYWLCKYRPQAVYVRTCFLVFLMYPICRLAKTALIAEVDAVVDEEARMRGQRKILVRILRLLDNANYRLVDGLACVTAGIRDEVVRRGADPDTTVVIQNAAHTGIMRPMAQSRARRRLGLDEKGYIIGFAGTFAPWQGLDLLVQAASQVVDNSPHPVRFVLVGDGQCRREVLQVVEKAALGRFFSFLEPMDYDRIRLFNSACDLTVIPIHDPRKLRYGISSLKFWDAVAVGVPVLVPAGCGLDDVLNRLALPGTFRPADKENLAEAILEVLAKTGCHQARRQEVHKIVREEYSWACAAEKLTQLCSRLNKTG